MHVIEIDGSEVKMKIPASDIENLFHILRKLKEEGIKFKHYFIEYEYKSMRLVWGLGRPLEEAHVSSFFISFLPPPGVKDKLQIDNKMLYISKRK